MKDLKKFKRILIGLKDKSPLPLLFENGYTPESIKKEIIETFSTYFEDKTILDEIAIKYLVPDWINLMRISIVYPNIERDLLLVLNNYKTAKKINKERTIEILASLSPMHIEAGNKFWSFLNLEIDKKELELDEFAQTSLKDISNIIEGISKTLYLEQLMINRVLRNKNFEIQKVIELKLGNVIDELINNSNSPNLFKTVPDNIKFSDWRNISAHHNYSVKKELIHCEYGTGEKKKKIILKREELYEKLEQCMRSTEILNLAHKIFGYDNMNEFKSFTKPNDMEAREEIDFLTISSGIMSQGFEIINLEYKNIPKAILTLKDLTNGDAKMRGIHSSQFLTNLWIITRKPHLEIRYIKQNGEPYLISKCDSEMCELVSSGKKKLIELAEKVEFELIKNSG